MRRPDRSYAGLQRTPVWVRPSTRADREVLPGRVGATRRLQANTMSYAIRTQPARPAGASALEDARLLRVELVVREHALCLQLAKLRELVDAALGGCRGRRRGVLLRRLLVGLLLRLVLLGPLVRLPAADAVGDGRRRPGDHRGAADHTEQSGHRSGPFVLRKRPTRWRRAPR